MDDCVFCRILAGDIPSTSVYEDDRIYAFRDIDPKAPTHILVIPRRHLASLNEVTPGDRDLLGHMMTTATAIAVDEGLAPRGYRLVINCGADGGQAVDHLHLHLLGGRALGWPPG